MQETKVTNVASKRWIVLRNPYDPELEVRLEEVEEEVCLIVLPQVDDVLYKRIKLVADTRLGLCTICVDATKLTTKGEKYMANVALKFNLKLGGINQKDRW